MSDKLISADKLIRDLKGMLAEYDGITITGLIKSLQEAPAVDAVEVVRCKDCEFCRGSFDPWTKTSVQVCGYVGYNPVQSSQVEDNDYCSHGERREENAVD